MAEVGLKEFTIVEVGIVGNSLSLSPLALVVTPVRALSLIISGTVKNGSDVLGNVSWGTEVSLWNQLNTISEGTVGWAFRFRGIGWAFVPVVVSHVGSSLWMAELISEERSHVKWSLWDNPFTL